MKNLITKAAVRYGAFTNRVRGAFEVAVSKHSLTAMIVFGVGLVAVGSQHVAFAQAALPDTRISDAAELILGSLIEGPFGALIMIVAGLVAIIAAAMGAYRAAMAALVVAVGAFILRTFVNLFFPASGLTS